MALGHELEIDTWQTNFLQSLSGLESALFSSSHQNDLRHDESLDVDDMASHTKFSYVP